MVAQDLHQDLLLAMLESYLETLPRIGRAIVMNPGHSGQAVLYTMNYAAVRVRKARAAAELGEHVTLDACRHGGMTELGDAELAEQGVMSLSGHRTPQAARLYIMRTDHQRMRAAAKRRAWVEESFKRARVDLRSEWGSRNGASRTSRNEPDETIQPIDIIGAGEGNRTLDTQLGKLMFCH